MTALPEPDPPRRCDHSGSRYVVDCAGAQLFAGEHGSGIVLCVDGEIDAANATLVGQAIRRFAQLKAPLIVDLSHVDFLGIAGFRTLLSLDHEQRQAHLNFCVVTGAALRRLMRIFRDPGLPVAESVSEALQRFDEAVRTCHGVAARPARQREPLSKP